MEPLLVDTATGFKAISVGHSKGYELINSGEIETVKTGSRRQIVVDSLRAYVERRRAAELAKREAA